MERPYELIFVDDETEILNTYHQFFEGHGFKVETAHDGVEGLEKIKGGNFDVAIIDLRIPELDGMALIRQIKHLALDTSIIIVTGDVEQDEIIDALNLGVDAWFKKQNLNMDELYERVYALAEVISLEEVRAILGRIPNR